MDDAAVLKGLSNHKWLTDPLRRENRANGPALFTEIDDACDDGNGTNQPPMSLKRKQLGGRALPQEINKDWSW